MHNTIDNTINLPKVSLRDMWYNYKSELWFLIVLSVCVAAGHLLSRWIPVESLNSWGIPFQHGANIAVCVAGAWLLFRRSDGLRIRKACAWALVAWGLADIGLMMQDYVFHLQVLRIGSGALNAYLLLVCNFLGWILLVYPTETLRPGWFNRKRATYQLLPMVALVGIDYLVPIDLWWVIALYPAVLFVLVCEHLRAYRVWCEENYSSMDNIDVQWVVRYLLMVLLVAVSYAYVALSDNAGRVVTQNALLFFVFAYSIEQILFRRDPWEGGEVESLKLKVERNNRSNECEIRSSEVKSGEFNSPQDDQSSNVEANKREAVNSANGVPTNIVQWGAGSAQRLTQWMESEKPYLNPDFQLMDLRAVLPMNRTYLSQFIRDEFGCTFYQFVIRYRIEEAKRLMTEQPELTIEQIAVRSGFSSRIVFTRTFTKETGLSPREWSQQCNNS